MYCRHVMSLLSLALFNCFSTHSSSVLVELLFPLTTCSIGLAQLVLTDRRRFGMASPFTIGIEEEFQIVDRKTGQLSPHILTIMEKGAPIFGEQIKPEM